MTGTIYHSKLDGSDQQLITGLNRPMGVYIESSGMRVFVFLFVFVFVC